MWVRANSLNPFWIHHSKHSQMYLFRICSFLLFFLQYIFADETNNYTFVTQNYGTSVTPVQVEFRPKKIVYHPKIADYVLGMDDTDGRPGIVSIFNQHKTNLQYFSHTKVCLNTSYKHAW